MQSFAFEKVRTKDHARMAVLWWTVQASLIKAMHATVLVSRECVKFNQSYACDCTVIP